jgi:sensor c-di-GMP phosphodiesterase-like protein
MRRREKVMIGVSFAAFAGVVVLLSTVIWYLWSESIQAEEQVVSNLASSLGNRTEEIFFDTQMLLQRFDELPQRRCSVQHLRALQDAAVSRPYLRAIGHWQANERLCGVGFLQAQELKPERADKIYDSGLIAWWPSAKTEVGGVRLFLMRFGNHDAAIDPRGLIDIGPLQDRQAGLWVEGLRLTAQPDTARLPEPSSIPIGLTFDRAGGRTISRFSRSGTLPIEVIAIEPLENFFGRYAVTLAVGTGAGLVLLMVWLYALMRYTRHRLSMSTLLRQAIARGRLHARYQPVVELKSGKVVGAEALARWTMEGGESIRPDVFIPLAEKEGLIADLTLSMLAAPLRELRGLLLALPQLSVNINLSPSDLLDDRFATALEAGLALHGLPSRAIKLEITERALVNTDTARGMIRRLREKGHEVAVDDFGTGFSSLSYLSSFELDVLKIDKSFVDAIGTGAATSHVIVHVIEMARSLGLKTVAEGVETEEQRKWLIEHGVDFGQGYLYSAPLTAEAFGDFARKRVAA